MIRFHTILEELDAGGWTANGEKYEDIIWKDDGKKKPTKKEFEDKKKELEAQYIANKYQRDRAVAYPSIEEQLDMQYWDAVNGTKKWQEAVAKVKTDNPKPE